MHSRRGNNCLTTVKVKYYKEYLYVNLTKTATDGWEKRNNDNWIQCN